MNSSLVYPMEKSVLIVNPQEFKLKKAKFIAQGANSIQVVTDFDKTLTTAFCKGKKNNSTISQIRHNNFLGDDYTTKTYSLFDKYYPIENDSTLSVEEKIPYMEEWWTKHLTILVEYGLNTKVIDKVINIQSKYLRKGYKKFFKTLSSKNIPVLILSSGLGDVIEGVLKKKKSLTKNIHVISNFFEFDKTGKATGYKGKIIHVLNKDESQIINTPHFEKITQRRNVILIGDSLGDLKMVAKIPYDEILKIGFLVNNVDAQLEEYKKNFDVVLLGDGSLDYVNELLKEIFKKK